MGKNVLFVPRLSSRVSSGGSRPSCRTQTSCDMIRNSIYKCYGIIPTIKEVFHLPSDLRLASQDTENDLIAVFYCSWSMCERCAGVCVCVLVTLDTELVKGVQCVQGLAFSPVSVGESGTASKHVYQAISRLAGRSLGGPLWSILHRWLDTQNGIICFLSGPRCSRTQACTHPLCASLTMEACSSGPNFRSGPVRGRAWTEEWDRRLDEGSPFQPEHWSTLGALVHRLCCLLGVGAKGGVIPIKIEPVSVCMCFCSVSSSNSFWHLR